MNRMNFETPNLTEQNIEKIAALFPQVITEAVDEERSTPDKQVMKRAIDFEKLRQVLSPEALAGDEAYDFTWVGKKEAMLEAARPIRKTLRPVKEDSKNWDTTENLYIEGDNLDALKLLQESYLGKVKMIYIDPPYNTGNDFVYKDNFSQSKEEYEEEAGVYDEDGDKLFKNTDSNGRFHSDWCSMIYPRLLLARNLLSEDGVIFISIDDNEVANLKKICDEVFGVSNFAACIPWQSRLSVQNDTDFSSNHEFIVVYAKRRRRENRRLKESNAKEWYKKDSFVFRPMPLEKSRFENPDNDPRGPWKADPFDAPNVRPNLTYPVVNPKTGVQHLPPSGRHWRISKEKFSSALADGRIVFGKSGMGRPQMKSFYKEKKDFGSIDNSWFSGGIVGTATAATKELQTIFKNAPFDTPKPTSLLRKLLSLGFVEKDDIVLDFFSGSATTAHAVMQLNSEDGGKRKYIMVQLPEETNENSAAHKAGYKNICEIGKERIRRAGKKIEEENEKLRESIVLDTEDEIDLFTAAVKARGTKGIQQVKPLFKTWDISHEIDTGFRVLRIDSTNMKDVYYSPVSITQDMLSSLESNIKDDRNEDDLLFGCLVDWGLPLSLPYTQETIEGCIVLTYNDGDLVACFDDQVPESLIHTLAKRKPLRVVFRDSSFKDSPAKINVTEIFKVLSPNTEIRVI